MDLTAYSSGTPYDELVGPDGAPRPGAGAILDRLGELSAVEVGLRQQAAEDALFGSGTTFNVYGETEADERIIPFDVVPRVIPGPEWDAVAAGCLQRVDALNRFLQDVYGPGEILKAGVVPRRYVNLDDPTFAACRGVTPPGGVYTHVAGIDLVRDGAGTFRVLEDNLRCPSGVSYVLENRRVLKRTFPRVFGNLRVRAVEDYPDRLRTFLDTLGPSRGAQPDGEPVVVVLTPGVYNSAYFEHSFLAQQMGVRLVEGSDLVVERDRVYMRTTTGLRPVDVIYRRIDDAFLDPAAFRKDSLLGVPGLMNAYRAGNVALANAPGAGIADNKVIYAFVPAMIRFYLGEEPKLPNVDTWLCADDASRAHVLEHLHELVVKPAHEAGGKGIVVGPHATRAELDRCRADIAADPGNFIAQPTLDLSVAPTLTAEGLAPRHVDLRPYVLTGRGGSWVLPGGLTRVALKKGSLIVNSSQGGGTKDTWIVDGAAEPG